jgi:hypothetical protein
MDALIWIIIAFVAMFIVYFLMKKSKPGKKEDSGISQTPEEGPSEGQ